MKILVIGSRIPFPQRDGGAVATYGMLREMAEQGHQITYFSFNTKKHFVSEEDIKKHFYFCKVIAVYLDATPGIIGALTALLTGENYNLKRFTSKKGMQLLKNLLQKEQFDLVHFESLFTISFLPVVHKFSQAPCVLRQHNVEFQIWDKLQKNAENPFKKWYISNLCKTLKKEEIKAVRDFLYIVSITADDESVFKNIHPNADFFLYPAGIKLHENMHSRNPLPFNLCHLGSMEWMPNVQALEFFILRIWPDIKLQFPNAEFHIAGKSLDKNDPRFLGQGVINHGEVNNAEEFIQTYSAVVVPLLSGSGLRMKTLEAMSLGIPVISTTTGAAGIEVENNKHIFIADSPAEWIAAIKTVFTDPVTAKHIAAQGKSFAENNYSLKTVTENLLTWYSSVVMKK